MNETATAAVPPRSDATRGLLALVSAFTIWGLLPLYIRLLRHVPPLQITAHRLMFCCVFVLGFLRARGAQAELWAALRAARVRNRLIASSLLIATNWIVFVWAVNDGRVVEASLGYFINPMLNVVLGVIVLREHLWPRQWLAVALAGIGVAYLTWLAGAPPWIALVLAATFGSYGLLRKTVGVDAMAGLGAETLLLTPIALAYLAYCEWQRTGVMHVGDPGTWLLLVFSGALTAVPLWSFAYGARRVALSTVGILQFIGPTISLLIGVVLFHEPFPFTRAIGFGLIWAGLVVYAVDGVLRRERGIRAASG